MIKVTIIAVGKLKEKFFLGAVAEYEKRLSRFIKLQTVEIEPARLSDNPSSAEIASALENEGNRILKAIPSDAYVTAMCIEGKQMTSEELSADISERAANGSGNRVFIIGGSYGLSDAVKKRADARMSMSKMTFPHKLARVMLLEQIYRAFMIESGGTYHK